MRKKNYVRRKIHKFQIFWPNLRPKDCNVSIHINDVRNIHYPHGTRITLHTLIIRSMMHFRFIEFQRISFRRTLVGLGTRARLIKVKDHEHVKTFIRFVLYVSKQWMNLILRSNSIFAWSWEKDELNLIWNCVNFIQNDKCHVS